MNLDGSQPTGVEPEIVRRFADSIGAKVQWVQGDSEELVDALEGGQLDVVIAGFTRTSEHRRKVALTRPYVDTELLLAHPRGESMRARERHWIREAVVRMRELGEVFEVDVIAIPASDDALPDRGHASFDEVREDVGLSREDVEAEGASGR